jgi:uncharacterized peroxidase-related enzyme
MSRLHIPTVDASPEESKPILAAVHQQLGVVPNLFRVIGNSPAALSGFAGNNAALKKTLDVKTRERIALAVAQINGCDYCLSAHAYLAANLARMPAKEVAMNRRGGSTDPRADAAVRFAVKVTETRGHVSDADLAAVRLAGFTDAQIVEIIANVVENVFTNYLNEVARTEIDFPVVSAADVA